MTNPPNPIHSHPEGPPDDIPLREYVEGRLSRLAADSQDRSLVLRQLYDREIDALTKLMEQRFQAMETAVNKALTAQKEAVTTALAAVEREGRAHSEAHDREHVNNEKADAIRREAQDKAEEALRRAVDKAEQSLFARLNTTNEWREQFNVQLATFREDQGKQAAALASREMVEREFRALRELMDERTAAAGNAITEVRDWKIETQSQMRTWAVAITFVVVVVNLGLRFL